MKYKIKQGWEKVRVPVLGIGGAGIGLISGELLSEFASRALGYTSYKKAGAKTAVKSLVGATFLGASAIPGATPFALPAAFATWGSVFMDWIAAKWTGGIGGLAERMAAAVRTWAMGAEKVSAELASLEQVEVSATVPLEAETSSRAVERQMTDSYGRMRNNVGAGRRF